MMLIMIIMTMTNDNEKVKVGDYLLVLDSISRMKYVTIPKMVSDRNTEKFSDHQQLSST